MKYTPEQYIRELRRRLQEIESGKALEIAVQDVHVKVVQRVFGEGKNSDGSQIGDYNTTEELYVNPKNSPRKFPTKGKDGKTKFKNGKSHKTGYFKSYASYRGAIGRPTGFVNLVLSGRLQSDYRKGLQKAGPLRWIASVTQENANKIEGNEDKYGKIFSLTEQEKEHFNEVLSFELARQLAGK